MPESSLCMSTNNSSNELPVSFIGLDPDCWAVYPAGGLVPEAACEIKPGVVQDGKTAKCATRTVVWPRLGANGQSCVVGRLAK